MPIQMRHSFYAYLICLSIWLCCPLELAEAAPYVYRDKLGRTVTFEAPAKRVAVLQLHECLPPLKAWDQVCALARGSLKDSVLLATAPEQVQKLAARTGDGNSLNVEDLIARRPDLVVIGSSNANQVKFLERCGLKVITVYPGSLRELYRNMDLMGLIFGKAREVDLTKRRMNSVFSLIQSRAATISSSQRQKVLCLNMRPTAVSGKSSLIDDLINLMGAQNVAGGIKEAGVDVSLEQIIKWNPDVIFLLSHANYTPEDLLRNPQWRCIKAIRTGRVYRTPRWSTWSPRLAPIALWMAVRIYPSAYRDIDHVRLMDSFCRDVYGVSYAQTRAFDEF